MIATIDIQVSASNPTIPLFPWRVFRKSLSNLRIRNVPKRIGNWSITSVSVSATYPDNQIITHGCTLVGGVWIATMPSCDVAGNVSRGYAVIAKGKDESGNDVSDYILGRGDIYVIDCDIKTNALPKTYSVTLCPNKPDNPNDGDIWLDGGAWYIYRDGETYTLGISKDDVTDMLDGYVQSTRKVNGKSLDDDVNLTASDVGAVSMIGGGAMYGLNDTYPASLDIYGGDIGGAQLRVHDSSAGDKHGEITIGDVKVRESITNITDKLAPVTGTLDNYIKSVVTTTYANANSKEY